LTTSHHPTALVRRLFGDWYGHIFTIERRKCVMVINEPTLFVGPAVDENPMRPIGYATAIERMWSVVEKGMKERLPPHRRQSFPSLHRRG
jgi:hypothetical protein